MSRLQNVLRLVQEIGSPGGSRWLLLFLLLSIPFPGLSGQCLPTSWILTGSVLDDNGAGIGSVDLDLIDPVSGLLLNLSSDFTILDGTFTAVICQVVPAGSYLLDINPGSTQLFFGLGNIPVTINGNTDLGSFVLPNASILSGRVVGESFEFLPFVDLDFVDSLTGLGQAFSGDFTGADGFFSTKVNPGFWDVQFTASVASTPLIMVPRELRDTPIFGNVDLGDVRLREGRLITGTVQDPAGNPVVSADIDLRDVITGEKIVTPGDNTNGSGQFSVFSPDGQMEIEVDPVQGSSLVPALSVIVVPNTGLDVGIITLPEGVSVSGSVVGDSGNIVPGTDLDFIISSTGIEIPTAHDNANSSGNFSVQVVPGTYDIAFRPSFLTGFAPAVLPSIEVLGNTNLGLVELPSGTAFTGTVLAGPDPVLECEILLTDSVTGAEVYMFGNDTDALGVFAVRQLPGVYDLLITPPIGSGLNEYVETGIDLTADLNLAIDLLGSPPVTPPEPVQNLACCCPGGVTIQWELGNTDYDLIQIQRQGVFLTNLAGDTLNFNDMNAPLELLTYQVIAVRSSLTSSPVICNLDNSPVTPPAPVGNLLCEQQQQGSSVQLTWVNDPVGYDSLQVFKNGVLEVELAGVTEDYISSGLTTGTHVWELVGVSNGLSSAGSSCTVDVTGPIGFLFLRGDANSDSLVNLADSISILEYLFSGGPPSSCQSSMDVNDSGTINIADAINLLAYLFSGGLPPELPFPTPGVDPTPDALPCP
ncbi:MAG: hypothetical protein GWP35_02340 [Proteobacteria bacterium]|nr:hypothetical protein [Pseudomonadota bacterium]